MKGATTGRVFMVSNDPVFFKNLAVAVASEGFTFTMIETAREAAVAMGTEEIAALIVDTARVPAADRESLAGVHRERGGFALFMLETLETLSPKDPGPLRRLTWPLPNGLIDAVRAVECHVVFLVDPALYSAKAFQLLMPSAGIQPVLMESHLGVADFLRGQIAHPVSKPPPTPRKRSLWDKFKGDDEAPAVQEAAVQRVVVAMFPGTVAQAEALDVAIRQISPEARCYLVTGGDSYRAAVKAVQDDNPAFVLRESSQLIPGILKAAAGKPSGAAAPAEKETIVILDSDKEAGETLAQALLNTGYQVFMAKDAADMEARVAQKGSVHLVVIGTAIAYAKVTARDLAVNLRRRDPDLRMIFMVEREPIKEVLTRLSEVVEIGVDDTLIKPVNPVNLLTGVEKALQRRRDLAEIKRLNQELGESNRQLGQINSFQTRFFHMVAHDVKNPLTAILGYCEVIGAKFKDNPDAIRYSSHIHSAAKALNALISDLVDLAAIESGKLRVDMAPMDLAAVVHEVKSRIDVVAGHRKIAFSVVLPPSPLPVQGDPQRLGQVIQNLCTNAIQYTKEGGAVAIRVDLAKDWMTVSVMDTGIGIAKEDIPRVWERFFQTAEAQKMRKGGFGLGLKIAREIVQRHGGEMGIESELGKGSRFFFHLPVRP
ncbi:MAG: hypothetical protein HZB91_03785 [Elusimicrobia bacterium]|nr:hypothetical protein [Elusimicrobiota bacterium]